jgi:hypothetical protein
MYTIRTQFQLFREVDLSELIGANGVYVIWDSYAKARPTYIGEGNLLSRFAKHVERDGRRFAQPWNGYVAIISGSTHNVHKEESKAVERLLLDIAKETDRLPGANDNPGSKSAVLYYCQSETLRIAITGYDPLISPFECKMLTCTKEIKVCVEGDNGYEIVKHDWRLRRRRAPIINT